MDWLVALTTLAPSIVAIVTLGFAYLQNKDNQQKQLQQLRAQWEHEEKKALIEGESTKVKEQREKLQNIYANSIRSLSESTVYIEISGGKGTYLSEAAIAKIGEAQHWLSLFVIYYHDKKSKTFTDFYSVYNTFSQQDGFGNVEYLRRSMIEFAANDPRLK